MARAGVESEPVPDGTLLRAWFALTEKEQLAVAVVVFLVLAGIGMKVGLGVMRTRHEEVKTMEEREPGTGAK